MEEKCKQHLKKMEPHLKLVNKKSEEKQSLEQLRFAK